MNLPKVSCFCATYGRPKILEESLESFLRQDYIGDKELIILNDFSGDTLFFNHPQVKIFNVKEHIKPLGKKFNETVKLCTGEILLPWEDDDIFLPHRITYTVNHMINGFFHTGSGFYDKISYLIYTKNYFHCNMAVSTHLWNKVGGYKEIDNCTLDVDLMARLKKESEFKEQTIEMKDVFYIYRWESTGSYHTSGWGSKDGVSVSENVEKSLNEKDRLGQYELYPHWKNDYVELYNDFLKGKKCD